MTSRDDQARLEALLDADPSVRAARAATDPEFASALELQRRIDAQLSSWFQPPSAGELPAGGAPVAAPSLGSPSRRHAWLLAPLAAGLVALLTAGLLSLALRGRAAAPPSASLDPTWLHAQLASSTVSCTVPGDWPAVTPTFDSQGAHMCGPIVHEARPRRCGLWIGVDRGRPAGPERPWPTSAGVVDPAVEVIPFATAGGEVLLVAAPHEAAPLLEESVAPALTCSRLELGDHVVFELRPRGAPSCLELVRDGPLR